jgi:hypothetical protein
MRSSEAWRASQVCAWPRAATAMPERPRQALPAAEAATAVVG